ncbi:MAG: Uma2 family endonuclease [candidate division KSB1 bacterium]|nr:Uma2 family endonuclease [candidate division KSB1 bacterium]
METLTKEKVALEPSPRFMTEEEFVDFCDEDIKAEFVDGEVIVHSPASTKHGSMSIFLASLVQFYVDQHNLGRVWGENSQVRLRPGLRRVPDLIFISKNSKVNITDTEVDGAPDLAVEIVSPDSVDRDWRDKFLEYEKAGVKEYWIIDPSNERMEIYCLNDQGEYERQQIKEGRLESKVLPGFWLRPQWLWQEPLPSVIAIARELKMRI